MEADESEYMNAFMADLIAKKQRAAEEKLLPMVPLGYTSPLQMIVEAFISRQQWEERIAAKSDPTKFQTLQTILGQETHFSSIPLPELKSILLKDMKVRQYHKVIHGFNELVSRLTVCKGKYLLCRIISPPNRLVCTAFTVEDTAGWTTIASLYNYPGTYSATPPEMDTLFPLNSLIAIREPHLKMTLNAPHPHIRIDSPTDLVFLEPGSSLLKNVGWATGERSLPVHTKTASEWKSVGDKHFKAKEFYGAIAGYSLALQREPSLISVRLNRALANLRVGRNLKTVEDARFVLTDEQLPSVDRVKALYRCAQAMYAEGKYAAAKKWYSKCILIDPKLADAVVGIQRCDSRIKEQTTGVYDWGALFEQEMKSPSMQVDIAEFQGPIEKRSMSHRGGGRGIVASRDIVPGELLAVSKPFALADSKVDGGGGIFIALDFLNNRMQNESQYILIQRAISRATSNPSDAEAVLDLYAGTKNTSSTVTKPPGERIPNLQHDIDSSKIEAICLLNSFGGGREGDTVTRATAKQERPVFLYILPSYFNHSCLPNAHRESLGDILMIRAMREIKKGEEITVMYTGDGSYEEREKTLKHWFPRCDCSLCEDDRKNGASRRGERKRLVETLNNSDLTVDQLRAIVKRIDATYSSGYGWFKADSSTAHQALALRLESVAKQKIQNGVLNHKIVPILKDSIREGFKSLEAMGVQILDKQINDLPFTFNILLPISTSRVPYDIRSCVNLCFYSIGRLCVLGYLSRAEMWMKAALWLEGVWKRDALELFKLRWSDALEGLGGVASVILDKIALSQVMEQKRSPGRLNK